MAEVIEKLDDLLPDHSSITALIKSLSSDGPTTEPSGQIMDEAETPISPHTSPRRVGFALIPAKPAVYACFAADGSPIVAATTANLRRALQNRLSGQTSATGRANYAEIADTVRYRRVGSAFAASWWYYRTVQTLFPDRYAAMLAWKPAWFVTINLATEFPRFHISNALAAASALCVGPLLTRRKAKAIAESMEDLFDLCRYYEILRQAPHGQACAYKELGKCPAPCDGGISMTDYHKHILNAAGFLSDSRGTRMQWFDRQESLMREAASTMDFRLAAALKRKLEQADKLNVGKLTEVHNMDKWKYLILQRGKTNHWVAPFVAGPGWIASLPEVYYLQAADSVPSWMAVCNLQTPGFVQVADFPVEEIAALVTYHKYRAKEAGLYIPMDGAISADTLRQALQFWLNYEGDYEMAEINSSAPFTDEDVRE